MAKILTINYYEYEPATSKYSIGDRDIVLMFLGNNVVGSFSVQLSSSAINELASQYHTITLTVNDSSLETGGYAEIAVVNESETEFYGTAETEDHNSLHETINTVTVPAREKIVISLSATAFGGHFSHWTIEGSEYNIVDGTLYDESCVISFLSSNDVLIQAVFNAA